MKYLLENPVQGMIGAEKYKTAIQWRNGILIADEPEQLGGKDLGPDPYTLLLASLVTCTLATLRMYIDHKGLPIPEIDVEANLFRRIENGEAVTYLERKITFPEQTDDVVQQRLLQVAEICPVSKMLKGTIKITTISTTY